MSTTDLLKHNATVSLRQPTLLTQPRDAYPYFLACKPEIETLLRAGHTMHRVWETYRDASPPFPATYETFRTYCGKHGLAGLRTAPDSVRIPEARSPQGTAPGPPARGGTAKIYPRLPDKPREFIPTEEE